MKNKLIIIILALLFSAASANAIELKLIEGDLTETGRFTEDYMFRGNTLDFRGQARDLFFFNQKLIFSGKTELAVNGLAKNVTITGDVNNGVKAAARNIDINGIVNGTSFLAGSTITLGKGSIINGDTFVGARKLTVQGEYKGDLYAGAGEIVIENTIEGDVTAYTGQLNIPEEGRINGNLTYSSEFEISPEEAARVNGKIMYEKSKRFFDNDDGEPFFEDSILPGALFKISFIIIGLLLLLLPVNRFLEQRHSGKGVLAHALWGLVPIFVYPSAFIVSILLLITLPLSLVLLLGFIPIVFVTKVLGLTMFGSYLAGRLNLNTSNRYLYFLIAVIPYSLLSFIPIFGNLLAVFVSSIGCGWLLSKLFNRDFS